MAKEDLQSCSEGKKLSNVIGIKDLPVAERPRERLLLVGTGSLSLSELLSVILGQGAPRRPVNELSNYLLNVMGGLNGLGKSNVEELIAIYGIGLAKACRLVASLELARRFSGSSAAHSNLNLDTKAVYELLKPFLLHKQKEYFMVISLDARRNLIGVDSVTVGTINESIIHPREVFKAAINRRASAIFIAHNHPSGDVSPSNEDILATKRLVKTSHTIGIPILDHIIFSDIDYLSMKESMTVDDLL